MSTETPFRLEHGKRYRTRDGNTTDGPVWDLRQIGYRMDSPFVGFVDGRCETWSENGSKYLGSDDYLDLVAEYTEPPPPKWVPFDTVAEMQSLIGQPIRRSDWDADLMTSVVFAGKSMILIATASGNTPVTAKELCDRWLRADGTPCGKQVPQ